MDAATGPGPRKFTGRKIAFLAVGALFYNSGYYGREQLYLKVSDKP